jgi:hypothetical protein
VKIKMTGKTTLGTIVAVTALTATPAYADFYDGAGLPPEKNWQEHIIADPEGITAITKYIPATGHTVSIVAVGLSKSNVNPLVLAQGYRFDMSFKDGDYVGILPMVQTAIGRNAIQIVPTLYTTAIIDKLTLDPRVQVPFTIQDKNATLDAVLGGITMGYQVAESVRIGPDVQVNILSPQQSLTISGIFRYDPPDVNGNYWVEAQLGVDLHGNGIGALQYRINF